MARKQCFGRQIYRSSHRRPRGYHRRADILCSGGETGRLLAILRHTCPDDSCAPDEWHGAEFDEHLGFHVLQRAPAVRRIPVVTSVS